MRKPKTIEASATEPKFDLQDFFVALGSFSLVAGTALIYVPAAVILAGVLCFVFAIMIERAR